MLQNLTGMEEEGLSSCYPEHPFEDHLTTEARIPHLCVHVYVCVGMCVYVYVCVCVDNKLICQ